MRPDGFHSAQVNTSVIFFIKYNVEEEEKA